MNTNSQTARYLEAALRASHRTPEDIAARVGLSRISLFTMMTNGLIRVPLDCIPALSSALDVPCSEFLFTALEEYYPEVHRLLTGVLGLPLTPKEEELVGLYRLAEIGIRLPIRDAVREELETLLGHERAA